MDRFHEPLKWMDVPDPKPGPQDVLINVRANGVCATDLKMMEGLVPTVTLPHILGHEVSGEIVELGKDVEGLAPGDHVTVYPTNGCGNCDACRIGAENHCLSGPRTGFELDGGFGQYLRTRARNAVKIDHQVPFEEAAILPDAVAAAYYGIVSRAGVQVGETVVIVGVGGLGIHAVQIAHLMGARVIAVDVAPEKLEAAESFGADATINGREHEFPAQVKELTSGMGADLVVEAVGGDSVTKVLTESVSCLKLGGRLLVLGYTYGQPLSVDSADLIYGQWSILGTRASRLQDVVEVARLVEQDRIKPVVSATFPLGEANKALEVLQKSSPLGRIVLTS